MSELEKWKDEEWFKKALDFVQQIRRIYGPEHLYVFVDGSSCVKARWGKDQHVASLTVPAGYGLDAAKALQQALDQPPPLGAEATEATARLNLNETATRLAELGTAVSEALGSVGDAFRDQAGMVNQCLCLAAEMRQFVLQMAATRPSEDVKPREDRVAWACSRLDFMTEKARKLLDLTREQARAELCGPDVGEEDC